MIHCAPIAEVSKRVSINEFLDVTLPPKRVVNINIRKAIRRIEAHIKSMPNALGADPFPLKHSFAQGIYIREIFIPKGYFVVGKLHRDSYLNIVVKGDMSVLTEEGVKRISGARHHVAPPGTKRFGFSHEDTIWLTIHSNPDNITDIETLEKMIHVEEVGEIESFGDCKELEYFTEEANLIDKNLFDSDKFRDLTKKVFDHEKDGFWSDWTPEQQELYMSGDWEAFSRSRGYSDEEISDLQSWLYMKEDGERKGINVLAIIKDLSTESALRNIMKDERGEIMLSSHIPSSRKETYEKGE